jgi:hypothetical protein
MDNFIYQWFSGKFTAAEKAAILWGNCDLIDGDKDLSWDRVITLNVKLKVI